ncbi:endonuclease/exonuclease/phosphatase family protein [Nonomuraea ferruginea]
MGCDGRGGGVGGAAAVGVRAGLAVGARGGGHPARRGGRGGAGLVLAAALRKRAAAALALAATVALGFAVVPRSLADGGTEPAGAPLRVLAANLMVGVADTGELMALVARLRPDVLALQELTPDAMERLEEAGLPETFPYAVTRPRQGAGGSALYARHPLTPRRGDRARPLRPGPRGARAPGRGAGGAGLRAPVRAQEVRSAALLAGRAGGAPPRRRPAAGPG